MFNAIIFAAYVAVMAIILALLMVLNESGGGF